MLRCTKPSKILILHLVWLDEWRKIGYLSEVLAKNSYISKDDYCDNTVSTPQQAYKCI